MICHIFLIISIAIEENHKNKCGKEYFIDKLYSQEEQQNLLNLLLRTFNFNLFDRLAERRNRQL